MTYPGDLITLKGRRVLVVDDDEVVCSFVKEILLTDGFQVVAISGMKEALKAVHQQDFHVMIADLKLMDGNGIELINLIGKIRPGLPCIVMTGYGTLETARSAIREGVYDFILKPFGEKELRVSVQSALRRSILAEENASIRQLSGLFEVSKAIGALMDIERLPNLILGAALSQTRSNRGIMVFFKGEGTGFEIASAVGWERDVVNRATGGLRRGPFADLIRSGSPVLITSNEDHPLKVLETLQCYKPEPDVVPLPLDESEEMILLPLRSYKKVLGTICLTKNGQAARFTHADLQILSILASHSGVAFENGLLMASVEDAYLSTFKSLAMLMEARDPMVLGHSQRVTSICDLLAHEVELDREKRTDLHYASSLHDVGKVAISERILHKSIPLSEDEWAEIKKHPLTAYRILEPVKLLADARKIILHHHERGDGSGYPHGLKFDNLTPADNILIVADMFDAMNSDRAYRPRIHPDRILAYLADLSGTQLDPDTVNALVRLYDMGKIEARR